MIDNLINIWNSLTPTEQVDLRAAFFESLTYSYHRTFFKKLRPSQLIKERWFMQFLLSSRNPYSHKFKELEEIYRLAG